MFEWTIKYIAQGYSVQCESSQSFQTDFVLACDKALSDLKASL